MEDMKNINISSPNNKNKCDINLNVLFKHKYNFEKEFNIINLSYYIYKPPLNNFPELELCFYKDYLIGLQFFNISTYLHTRNECNKSIWQYKNDGNVTFIQNKTELKIENENLKNTINYL